MELSIHIVSWLLIFGFPLVFMDRGSGFNLAQFLRHSCVPLCYFVIFYVNYLCLVPRYMFTDEMRKYILSNAVLILCLSVLLHVFLESISTPPPPEFARHIPPRWIFYARDMGMMIFVAGLGAAIRTSLRWRQAEERLIEAERQKTEAELKNLKNQLNPHFLYNTLDSIKWNARINQVPEIAVLAENLAVILRKSISSRPFITLREELETIESYVEIQKIRFTGRFLYETEIPDQLEDCMVPKMILQPLVENAIIHGLDGCGHGYICIYAFQKEGILNISVTDNGCGMSREMEDWINSDAPAKRDGHLGLYNVINILKIYYGQEYGVKAAVTEDGTTITLRLPVQKEVPDV